jgi:hypothetical protein
MPEVGDARFAVLVPTADDPDAHSGTDQLEEPPGRHHLDRRHAKRQPGLAHSGQRLRVPAGDRDADGGPVPPDGRDQNGCRSTQSFNLGAWKRESGAPANRHTYPTPAASIAVDDHSTRLPTQRPVRASQNTGRAGCSFRAPIR